MQQMKQSTQNMITSSLKHNNKVLDKKRKSCSGSRKAIYHSKTTFSKTVL